MLPVATWALLFLWALACPAQAVVPALLAPLAALLAIFPQIWLLILGALSPFVKRKGWLALLGLLGFVFWWLMTRETRVAVVAPTPTRPPLTTGSWEAFRGQPDGSGKGCFQPEAFAGPPATRWCHSDGQGSQYLSSPVVCERGVLIGSCLFLPNRSAGALECLDLKTGEAIWRALTRRPVFGSPVAAQGRVYCGEGFHQDSDCSLYCWDSATGKELYRVPTRGHLEAAPTLYQNKVYFSAGGDGFYCAQSETGKVIWHAQCGHCDCSAALAEGRLYAGSAYGDNAAFCLDAQTGQQIWKSPQNLPCWGHPALAQKRVFLGIGDGTFGSSGPRKKGAVVALQQDSGKLLWRTDLGDSVNSALCLDGGRIYAGSRDGFLYALDQASGKILWKAACGSPVLASPCLFQKTLLVLGGDGHLHALETDSGRELWKLLVSAVPCESSPIWVGARLYLGSGTTVTALGR